MTVPAISPTDLDTTPTILNRSREAQLYAPEESLCLYRNNFHTSYNYSDVVALDSGTPTITIGQGKCTYDSASGAQSGSVLAPIHLKGGQATARVRVTAHNSGAGGYNDLCVGFAMTTTSASDTIQYKFIACWRKLAASTQMFLQYEHGGGQVFTTPFTFTPTLPFDLIFILNHNSVALAVEEDGVQRILQNQEIAIGHQDLELQATVDKLRPIVYWQGDAGQTSTISNWRVTCNGTLGNREHVIARYDNGEPIKSSEGFYYITMDCCGPTTLAAGNPTQNSEFMKNQSTTRLYDADTHRFLANTAKYFMQKGTKVFGCQEGTVVYDRSTGLFHLYFSEWNDTSDRATVIHIQTYENILHGVWVFSEDEWDTVDLSALGGVFAAQGYYCSGVTKKDGFWYITGTVNGSSPARTTYCAKGTDPEVFTTLLFNDSTLDEGGYFWHVGSEFYVVTNVTGGSQKIMDRTTGATVATLSLAGGAGSRYPQQMDLLQRVRGGKTQYIGIGFSDIESGGAHGEDYKADFSGVWQSLAFGPDIILDFGTFAGEQFASSPLMIGPRTLLSVGIGVGL